jgi:hypothetical protein
MSFMRASRQDADDDLDGVARDADEPIDLGLGHDQRRREVDRVARRQMRARRGPRASDDAALHHLGLDALRDLLVAGEVLLGRAVFHEVHRGEQSLATANVACAWGEGTRGTGVLRTTVPSIRPFISSTLYAPRRPLAPCAV